VLHFDGKILLFDWLLIRFSNNFAMPFWGEST